MDERRKQVANQCRAVAHQAKALCGIYTDYVALLESEAEMGGVVDMKGQESAALMEYLGDCLNGMDAVTDDDAWLDPIFEAAHEMFPVTPNMK